MYVCNISLCKDIYVQNKRNIYMKNLVKALLLVILLTNCKQSKPTAVGSDVELNPYNPIPKMELLKKKNGKEITKMHFLVFGDSKDNPPFKQVLQRADSLHPDFCLTTGDIVSKGAGDQGIEDYKKLNQSLGWFLKKYPMWTVVGNHEVRGGDDGLQNFSNFYDITSGIYSFEYGNAKFIALPWPKIKNDKKKLAILEKELKSANGKLIFVFKHRPHYDVGSKRYKDVEGSETTVTKLFDKYMVAAVFSGHDHIYYRTKRNNTTYIISAGAGATIYPLKREKDAIEGDAYYGRCWKDDLIKSEYKFVSSKGVTTNIVDPMYYLISVKIDGGKVEVEMIDAKTGKIWDNAIISNNM